MTADIARRNVDFVESNLFLFVCCFIGFPSYQAKDDLERIDYVCQRNSGHDYGDLNARGSSKHNQAAMWTILILLLVLWALGMLTSYTLGGLLHILLVVAVVLFIVNLVRGRRTIA
jgi:hypothetical protein